MPNINLDRDIIYEYWRWQYIRRNEEYLYEYDAIASYLNSLGVKSFDYVYVDEFKKKPDISSMLIKDRELSESEINEIETNISYFVFKYKIPLPFHPDPDNVVEPSSTQLLEMMLNNDLNYSDLPRAPYQEVLTVSPRYQLDESEKEIMKHNQRFLNQNPEFNLPDAFFPSKESTQKFNVFNPESKLQTNKEKKYLNAWQDFIKKENSDSYESFLEAEREKNKAILQNRGKRIKSNQLARAVGLYLWDNWKDKKSNIINEFLHIYEEDDRLTESFKNEDNLRKRLNITNKCIKQREVMPTS